MPVFSPADKRIHVVCEQRQKVVHLPTSTLMSVTLKILRQQDIYTDVSNTEDPEVANIHTDVSNTEDPEVANIYTDVSNTEDPDVANIYTDVSNTEDPEAARHVH